MAIKKVLVVDDSPVDLKNIRDIVNQAGCVVMTATSGEEALRQAIATKPDLIFLDILMSDMDGFEACRRLARDQATKNIPVVFVSGKNQLADRLWAQMQGAKGYVTKPYTARQIVAEIKAIGQDSATKDANSTGARLSTP